MFRFDWDCPKRGVDVEYAEHFIINGFSNDSFNSWKRVAFRYHYFVQPSKVDTKSSPFLFVFFSKQVWLVLRTEKPILRSNLRLILLYLTFYFFTIAPWASIWSLCNEFFNKQIHLCFCWCHVSHVEFIFRDSCQIFITVTYYYMQCNLHNFSFKLYTNKMKWNFHLRKNDMLLACWW